MEIGEIIHDFRIYEGFDFLRFRRIKIYETTDFTYGEFFLYEKGKPKYYYSNIASNGKDKITDTKDISKFLQSKFSKCDVKSNSGFFIKLKDLGVKHVKMQEVLSF